MLETEGDASGWAVAAERAAVAGDLGDLGARRRWLERALDSRPHDLATLLDLGEVELADGRLDAATVRFEQAVAEDTSSVPASLMASYARSLATGAAIIEPATVDTAHRPLARVLLADAAAYSSRLSDPVDPFVAVLRSAQERARSGPPGRVIVRVRAERPASPSAQLAFRLGLAASAREGDLIVEGPPRPARFGPLWSEAADTPPITARPPDALLERVSSLCAVGFDWSLWSDRAAAIAKELSGEDEARLLDCLAHPPPLPSPDVDAVVWVHGFQVAAALLIGHGKAPVNAREDQLASLLSGVDDWSAAAAILGLRALCRGAPDRRDSVSRRMQDLLTSLSDSLPPFARALSVVGAELSLDENRSSFLALRSRVRAEQDVLAPPFGG